MRMTGCFQKIFVLIIEFENGSVVSDPYIGIRVHCR